MWQSDPNYVGQSEWRLVADLLVVEQHGWTCTSRRSASRLSCLVCWEHTSMPAPTLILSSKTIHSYKRFILLCLIHSTHSYPFMSCWRGSLHSLDNATAKPKFLAHNFILTGQFADIPFIHNIWVCKSPYFSSDISKDVLKKIKRP